MKVMITGATGFLGSHIVDKCMAQGDEITVLVRKSSDCGHLSRYEGIKYVYGDLVDTASLVEACRGREVVYHSAARATDWGSWRQFHEANYLGSKNVLEACQSTGVKRLVYISSPSVVFDFRDEINIDESHPYPKKFANHYSRSKAMAERMILAANKPGRLATVSLRPHAIWGPRDRIGFMPQIMARARQGKLKDLSAGKEVLIDMCYVENAADACLLAAKAPSLNVGGKSFFITDGETVNAWKFMNELLEGFGIPRVETPISPGLAMTIAAVVELVWKITRLEETRRPPLTRYSIGMMTHSTTYTIEAARRAFGYRPRVSVKTGLQRLKKWVDEIGGLDEYLKYAG